MSKYDHLIGKELSTGSWSWNSDTALLYAAGVGCGLPDPLDELEFSTENAPGQPQAVLPTFLTMLNVRDGDWTEPFGWNEGLHPIGVVHGEQQIILARPIPTEGCAVMRKELLGVYDKGDGALIVMQTHVTLADTGEYLGSQRMSLFAHGKGGFGGPRSPAYEETWVRPSSKPDMVVSLPVGLNQSLIYRLSGDRNLHGTHPAKATADGFSRPIFYGLGTFGVVGRALLQMCERNVARFGGMEGRFSKPVYPGDRLDTHIWHIDGGAVFQTLSNGERVVLDRGVFRFAA